MMNDAIARYREAALVVRRDELAALVVRGPDRVRWLNGMVSNDVAKAAPGRAVRALAVERKGKILAEFVVLVRGEDLVLLVHRAVRDAVRTHFDHHLIMDDAEIGVLDGVVAYEVVGRDAAATLDRFAHEGVGEAHALAGEDGYFIAAVPVPDAVQEDEPAIEALRVGRGIPRFRIDFDERHYPQEALLERTHVAFDKGCYLGQEVVCMLELRGHVKRRLALVAFEGDVARGAPVTRPSGDAIGEIAGVADHPLEAGRKLAFALLKVAAANPGEQLLVGAVGAVVVVPPLAGPGA
jgi:folate-binding protein YgfZ